MVAGRTHRAGDVGYIVLSEALLRAESEMESKDTNLSIADISLSDATSEAVSLARLDPGTSDRIVKPVSQIAHGFSVGESVYFDGFNWISAQANNDSSTADALVYSIEGVDDFTIIHKGWMTATTGQWDAVTGGSGGLTVGDNYLLSQSDSGELITVTPISGIAQFILKAESTTEALIYIGEPYNISSTSEAESIAVAGDISEAKSIAVYAESFGSTAESVADIAESLARTGTGGSASVPNIVLVDPVEPVVVGERYQTWSAADTYVQTQSPSSTNKWAIKLTGTNSEDIILRSYVPIIGESNVTRLTGAVNGSGGYGGDFFEYYISDCEITNISLGSTYTATLSNCRVTGTTITSTGSLIALKSNIDGGDYTTLTFFFGVHCILGSVDLPSGSDFILSQLGQASGSPDLNGGTFRNSIVENAGTYGAGSYYMYNCLVYTSGVDLGVGVDVEMYNCSGRSGTINVNTGATLLTANCIEMAVNENGGSWINRGSIYDNVVSGLNSTDIQGAIDELAESIGTVDISERASIATVSDSLAERAESLARTAVEVTDISEASSIGQRAKSIALKAEENASEAQSEVNIAMSYAVVADSMADKAESLALLTQEAEFIAKSINQTTHGFSIGQPIYFDGSNWQEAQTDTDAKVADAVIFSVEDADNFTAIHKGWIVATTGQWDAVTGDSGGLTTGQHYLVSQSISGSLTVTKPSTGIVQFVLKALSSTEALVYIGEPFEASVSFLSEATSEARSIAVIEGASSLADVLDAVNDWNDSVAKSIELRDYSETYTTVISSSGVLTLNIETGNVFITTLTENVTSLVISNPPTGNRAASITLKITQDSTTRTFNWGSVLWSGGLMPDLSTVSAVYIVELLYIGGIWHGFLAGSDMQ